MINKIIFLSIVIAILAAFFASGMPDGLEKVAHDLGFLERGISFNSILTDYSVPFVSNPIYSTALAGILGIFLTFGIFWLFLRVIKSL